MQVRGVRFACDRHLVHIPHNCGENRTSCQVSCSVAQWYQERLRTYVAMYKYVVTKCNERC